MIQKEGNKYTLRSRKTGKKLGSGTKKEMVKRERQIEWFKSHQQEK